MIGSPSCGGIFDLAGKQKRVAELEEGAADPELWGDPERARSAREIGRETVRYVRNVFKYSVAYQLAWEYRAAQQAVTNDSR